MEERHAKAKRQQKPAPRGSPNSTSANNRVNGVRQRRLSKLTIYDTLKPSTGEGEKTHRQGSVSSTTSMRTSNRPSSRPRRRSSVNNPIVSTLEKNEHENITAKKFGDRVKALRRLSVKAATGQAQDNIVDLESGDSQNKSGGGLRGLVEMQRKSEKGMDMQSIAVDVPDGGGKSIQVSKGRAI